MLELPGVLAYSTTREKAIAHVEALTLRTIAERLKNGWDVPGLTHLF